MTSFSEYTNIARDVFTATNIFGLDTSGINLVMAVSVGMPTPNAALNPMGDAVTYIHARMRADDDPSALYDDGSDGVWYPLKGRVVAVGAISNPSLLIPPLEPTASGLLLYPGAQLPTRYQGVDGVFVLIRNRQHPYDLSAACGLRINGFWKHRLG